MKDESLVEGPGSIAETPQPGPLEDTLLSIIEARIRADYQAALAALESRVTALEAYAKELEAKAGEVIHKAEGAVVEESITLESKVKAALKHIGVEVERFF